MPYKILHEKDGYYVYEPKKHRFFSKKGLTKTNAERQRIAIILSEHPKLTNVNKYFL